MRMLEHHAHLIGEVGLFVVDPVVNENLLMRPFDSSQCFDPVSLLPTKLTDLLPRYLYSDLVI